MSTVGGRVDPPAEDGWYPDTDMDTYLAWPLVSGSVLGVFAGRTPLHAYHAIHYRDPADNQAAHLQLGSVAHTAVLEPDMLDTLYYVLPEPDPHVYTTKTGEPSKNPAATKAYKEAVANLADMYPTKTAVDHDQYTKALAVRDSVHAQPRAAVILKAPGRVEHSAVVKDPATGVRLKIRPDKWVDGLGMDINLKTTRCAAYERFSNDVYRFGYYRSAALRKRALTALGVDVRSSVLIAVETEGPQVGGTTAVYELDEGAMDAGDQLVTAMLEQLARCYDTGTWPGYPIDVQALSLPPWAWAKVDEEVERYYG